MTYRKLPKSIFDTQIMKQETKNCQNCKKEFVIEPEDFNFYEKIKVPPPTWCPECRFVRRLVWRNEITFYKRKCDSCGENKISIHGEDSKFKVYCHDCWYSDKWDPVSFGTDIDFNRSFVEQFSELFLKVPQLALYTGGLQVNSPYINFAANDRNCYLCFGGVGNEQLMYAKNVSHTKDSSDINTGNKLELCYQDVQCDNSFRLIFSQLCDSCTDSMFLYDCRNCQNCFACAGLRNKSHCIWNKQYTREEYLKKIEKLNLESFENLENIKKQFRDFSQKAIHKYGHLINAKNSTGDNLINTRNCNTCFDLFGKESENCKYTHWAVWGVKDSYDNYGMPAAERVYETIAIGFNSNNNTDYRFVFFVRESHDIFYSHGLNSCHDCFGCVGLSNKSYCILNKQYEKVEYEQLIPKIIKHMNDTPYKDSKGRIYKYGEFFPPELSPFCYNETIAQEYFPLTKEEAFNQGYRWKDKEERNYKIDIKTEEIPDNIKETDESIIGKVIECEHRGACNEQCTEAFKIIPAELQFYQRMNLPLPHLCPNCRHYQRLKQRNPFKLWHRKCMNKGCSNEFETSYAPDRPEIIYCESCYNKEVY